MKSPRGGNNVTCPTYALKDHRSPFAGRRTMYDQLYRPIIMPKDTTTITHMEQFSCCWLHEESTAAVSWFLQRPARVVLHEHQVCHSHYIDTTRLDTTLDTVTSQRVLKPRLNPAALLNRAMLRPLVSHFKPVEGPKKKHQFQQEAKTVHYSWRL